MDADRGGAAQAQHHGKLAAALADPKTWVLAFIYFTCACAVYTLTFWLPTLVKGLGISDVASIGWYTAIPFSFGAIGILLMSRSSDHFKERRWHVASSLIIGSAGTLRDHVHGGRFPAVDDPAVDRGVLHLLLRAVLVDSSDLPEP
ncbi:MAG: MFS transporter [Polaromonas sp.]